MTRTGPLIFTSLEGDSHPFLHPQILSLICTLEPQALCIINGDAPSIQSQEGGKEGMALAPLTPAAPALCGMTVRLLGSVFSASCLSPRELPSSGGLGLAQQGPLIPCGPGRLGAGSVSDRLAGALLGPVGSWARSFSGCLSPPHVGERKGGLSGLGPTSSNVSVLCRLNVDPSPVQGRGCKEDS